MCIRDSITDSLIQTLADAGTLTPENGEDELDAAGLMISPGLVDTHIHFRDPGFTYKEDLHTGSLAAAAGGFTSVICMANTSPVIDSVPVLKELMEREALEDIHMFQAAAVSYGLKGEEMTAMKERAAAGACGFTDDGIPLKNAAFLDVYKRQDQLSSFLKLSPNSRYKPGSASFSSRRSPYGGFVIINPYFFG